MAIDCRRQSPSKALLAEMGPKRRRPAREVFAGNVHRIRRLQEISQEELAERAGLHRTYVGEVERGERNPSIDVMERLAEGLSVPLVELLVETPRQ